jgi:hypothetical protein
MNGENGRKWLSYGLATAALAAALGFTGWTILPRVYEAAQTADDPLPVFALVARYSLPAGLIAAAIVYGLCAAIARRWTSPRAIVLAALIVPGMFVVDVSATGYIHAIASFQQPDIAHDVYQPFAVQRLKDHEDYRRDLSQTGFPHFLFTPSLGSPGGLDRAVRKIAMDRQILARYRAQNLKRYDTLRANVRAARISENTKKDIQAKFDRLLRPEYDARTGFFDSADKLMVEYAAMLDDLVRARTRWHAAGGTIYFSTRSDLTDFNRHMATIQALDRRMTDAEVTADQKAGATNLAILGALRPDSPESWPIRGLR